jgi:hypothetical protein
MAEIPKWKRFERLIHDQYAISGATITLDDHIQGQDSKIDRQIDISIVRESDRTPYLLPLSARIMHSLWT